MVEKSVHGKLYIVPTPIGNLNDISQRALTVLQYVDLIAAENVQHTNLLLQRFSINACSFITLNSHNEQLKSKILIRKLKEGKNIALVSNAGTPIINDPGRYLVRSCLRFGIRVVPLPGPCAAITALSSSGLSSCRFCYEGFLPTKFNERRSLLRELETEQRTIIFYESTHRLLETLNDIKIIWGRSRYIVLAKELTKVWETVHGAPVSELLTWIGKDVKRCKGEIVLITEGYKKTKKNSFSSSVLHTFNLLRDEEFSFKRATILTAKIHNVRKNELYKCFLNQNKILRDT